MRDPTHIAPTEDRIRIRHRVDGIVSEVLENVRSGKRFFSLRIPAVRLKHAIGLRIMEELGRKSIVLAPNAAVQHQWLESTDGTQPRLRDLAMHISDAGSAHTVSVLPFSCAPILLLSYQRTHLARIDDERMDAEVERLVRHLVKHVYSLVILDECDAPPPFWEKAIALLRARSTAVILEFSCWETRTEESRGMTGNCPIRYAIPLTACIRESFILPFQSYLYPAPAEQPAAEPGKARAEDTAHDAAMVHPRRDDDRIEAAMEILPRVAGADPDGTRVLIVTGSVGGRDAPAGGSSQPQSRLTSVFARLGADGHTAALHPIVLTGSSFLCHDDLVIPILAAAQKVINLYGWSLEITHTQQDEWSEVFGSGPDWNSRSYVRIARQLLAERITRCLVADDAELRHGWEFLAVDAIVDLSGSGEFFHWNQQEHTPKSSGDLGRQLVTIWHVLGGGEPRMREDSCRLRNAYAEVVAPADDGIFEKGLPHIHPGIRLAGDDILLPAAESLRAAMAARYAKREDYLRLWQIGTPALSEERMCIEFLPTADSAQTLPVDSVQRRALAHDRVLYHERARTTAWQQALWGAVACGSIMSMFLLLPMQAAIVSAMILALLYTGYALRSWITVRRMRPSCAGVSQRELLSMLGEVVLQSRDFVGRPADRISERSANGATAAIEVRRRATGGVRVYLRDGTYTDSSVFARALSDLLQPVGDQESFLRVFGLRTGTLTVHGILKMSAIDTLLMETGLLPVPVLSSRETDAVHRYLESARTWLGKVELVSREDEADRLLIDRYRGRQLLAGEIVFRTISV